MAYSGNFKPKNPDKYRGDSSNIIYRSLWEFKLMKYLDVHPNVLSWASEEFCIPYKSPIDRKTHRYFPDFWVRQKDKNGIIQEIVIEVKPSKHLTMPERPARQTRKYISEVKRFAVNQRKFEAAREFCRKNNMEFMIMTEHELGIK